jgi:hypothetical protein
MNWTRRQKEQAFINEKKNSLLSKRYNDTFYCKECNQGYKGHEMNILEGYRDSGNKHYVTAYYYCPKHHQVLKEDSPLFSDTIVDHFRTVIIIAAVILIFILILRYCPSDLPPIKYK